MPARRYFGIQIELDSGGGGPAKRSAKLQLFRDSPTIVNKSREDQPRRSFIGRSSRLNGSRINPRFSSVMIPRSGSSPGSPRITGVWPSSPLRAIWHSDTFLSIVVPSAKVKLSVFFGLSLIAFQTFVGISE